jgi:hypothetical protein
LTDVLKGNNERDNSNRQDIDGNKAAACGMKVAHAKERGEQQSEQGWVFL